MKTGSKYNRGGYMANPRNSTFNQM